MGEGSSAERVPPHNHEAEVAVLGAIVLEPKAMSAVAAKLQPECFYRADHQKLYASFANLFAKNQPIDVVSVREELKRMGEDDIAGNADLFMTLGGAVPSIANAEYYAEVVRKKYLLRTLISACNESLVEAYDESQETNDILGRAEERIFNVATHYEASRPIEVKEIVQEVVDTIMNHPERLLGIKTEFADLDHWAGGLHRGEFVVIGGRPSTGKTTLAINMIERIGVRQEQGILMFSLEMARQQIAQNLLCCNARMDSTPLRTGQLDKSQWGKIREAASNLYDAPVFIDDSSGLTISDIRAKCRRMFAQHDIKLIVVDYLQLMSGERRGRDSGRLQEITDISRGLKGLAKELDVPVIALSQLSRAAEGDKNPEPRLSHLRESGAIEQDADLVLLLHRPNPDDEDPGSRNVTNLIIAKQRNGPTETVKLTFRKNELRFENFSAHPAAQMGAAPVDDEDDDPEPF
jgi:replicative DNA helicase